MVVYSVWDIFVGGLYLNLGILIFGFIVWLGSLGRVIWFSLWIREGFLEEGIMFKEEELVK